MVAAKYELKALGTVLSSELGVISLTCTKIVQQFSTTNSTPSLGNKGHGL